MLRHHGCVGLVVVAAEVLWGGIAQAQRKDGGHGWPSPWGPIYTVGLASVEMDLGLEGEALANVKKIHSSFVAELKSEMEKVGIDKARFDNASYANLSAEQRTAAVEKRKELSEKFALQLKKALTTAQFERLQQIGWQSGGGAQALLQDDPDLVKLLDITKDQQETFLAISREFVDKCHKLGRLNVHANLRELQAKTDELREERDRQLIDVLTKDQQERYTKLKGKPFGGQEAGRRDGGK